jgi:glycerol-3-phosphate acyltransferase PlsX
MGGDCGSEVLINGAAQAVKKHPNIEVLLLGPEELLREKLARLGKVDTPRLSIVHAPQTISMAEEAVEAVRRKKDSTVMVGFDLVRQGQAEAMVSAGHSGATMAAAILQLGRLRGISRPSIASFFPTLKEPVLVTDIGANVDCRPQHLYQFAVMASFCCKLLLNRAAPRVGLLSIGEEPGKGNAAVKEAHELLKASSLNFIGNVEGRDVYKGDVDVVVCDGFVGNITLKISEGLAEAIQQMLRAEIKKYWRASLASLFIRPAFKAFRKRVDYAEYGGAPLLGINGVGIICHGTSSVVAIRNAIKEAAKMVECRVNEAVTQHLQQEAGQS